jgi:hypothetical protein
MPFVTDYLIKIKKLVVFVNGNMMRHAMGVDTQWSFNAANVADAIFSSMVSYRERNASSDSAYDPETVQTLLASIDDGLKAAGLSFAEYLDRIRNTRETSIVTNGLRWRYSARERTMQQVDSAMAHLCALMRQANSY